jgi:hypothetical protein
LEFSQSWKSNLKETETKKKEEMSKASVKLTAKWQLDAALLSRPVDLTSLVSMSRNDPESFLEDNTLHRLVTSLLNEKNNNKSDKDTKLDVLNILANVAVASKKTNNEVRSALQSVSEWFDEYMAKEESTPGQEPELNKAMVLLLARCWDYRLKTEDVLELTQVRAMILSCVLVTFLTRFCFSFPGCYFGPLPFSFLLSCFAPCFYPVPLSLLFSSPGKS